MADELQTQRRRPRVFYVSYDGMGEPLGRSQVLAYLFRLAREYEITLLSFEKPDADLSALRQELSGRRIDWVALRYHRRPPVLSTMLDVRRGVRALGSAAKTRGRPEVVHVRSYVPALIALLARRRTGGRFLFDIRGFWADERVEGGLWAPDGALYRIAKRCERWYFAKADAIVTLTEASVTQIRAWTGERELPIVVIPTCVDLPLFAAVPGPRDGGPHAVWCGSIGTWYRFEMVKPLVYRLGLPLDVLTRQLGLARDELDGLPATIRECAPEKVPGELACRDIGLCLVASSFSKQASSPTRFGEYLAAGMPVVVTPGVGDLEAMVTEYRVGVVMRGVEEAELARVADEISALVADPDCPERCRRLARDRFDVEQGSRRYAELYRQLL